MNNIPSHSLQSFCSLAWEGTKQASLMLEPYQPTIAGLLILGKLGWRVYKHRTWNAEANALSQKISILKEITEVQSKRQRESRVTPGASLGELEQAEVQNARACQRIEDLQIELSEKRSQLSATALTVWQIPSLLFAHPGANAWNSAFHIVNRGVQMHEQVHSRRSRAASWAKKIANVAGSALSLAGTTASLLRQQGFISKENQTSHALIGLALGVHAIEGIIMTKNAIASLWKNRA